ncbi:hypothetical protein [Nitrospirillum iridis]|uniref:Uncharacterized protein n=1 Tax=Nitrospirillum iridis TaxID=765888 RepID=A0A7X0AZK7_9PROT|nr:hypothetical protein [Nitrospirillum iridis]MBB6253042.1 hypothetical protein [Nitrospirillum iridis]
MQLPVIWTETLHRLHDKGVAAVIAGGCLRDLDNGRPIKDIDVMVTALPPPDDILRPNSRSCVETTVARLDQLLGVSGSPVVSVGGCEYVTGLSPEVLAVYDYSGAFGPDHPYPVQVIILDPAEMGDMRMVDRMDFGICRVAYTGGAVVKTPEYERDKTLQRFTLCREPRSAEDVDRARRRFDRLSEKYPGWIFVNPYA